MKCIVSLIVILTTIQIGLAQPRPVVLNVDVNHPKGVMKPIWAWYGYDEPNYTYMKDGKKLLSELSTLSPVPVYVRAHNLMTTGDGTPALKWGSTNMYTEDKDGNPVYSWTIIDQIFDTYIQRGMKPLAQLGFMPEALSIHPQPYQHNWKPGDPYNNCFTGWAYPPKDYKKWGDLVYNWVKHCVERYGQKEVESWYWEVWNEPNGYWKGTMQEYFKLYDYSADAVKRALPTARIGGLDLAGTSNPSATKWLSAFLVHCDRDTNYATGKIGAPLDVVLFHAKGSPKLVNGMVEMNMGTQLRDISVGLSTVTAYPKYKDLPIIIGESDPEGCAACGMATNPSNAYRNGTMYSSYTAASVARIYELADHFGANLIGAVNWSFEFENQPWFYGFRDLATNGVDKPVLNVFRMLGKMTGNRVGVTGNLAYDFKTVRDSSVRGPQTDINALACADKNKVTVLIWNYHDDDLKDAGSPVEITVNGISGKKARLTHYRIDQDHSNSYETWIKMGSPQRPTNEQIAKLEKSGQLEMISAPEPLKLTNHTAIVKINLPRQAVSLIEITF